MQITNVLAPLLLSSLAAAGPLSKAPNILKDLNSIKGYASSLETSASKFNGGIWQSLSLVRVVGKLEKAVTSTTKDVHKSTPFPAPLSASVLDSIKTMEKEVEELLTTMEGKKDVLAATGHIDALKDGLKTIQTDTDALFVALEEKSAAGDAAKLETLKKAVDSAFTTGLATF